MIRKIGAGERSRTFTALRPTDFESAASAIPPLRLECKSSGLSPLLQDDCSALESERDGRVDGRSFSRREDLVETRGRAAVAFQMRVAKAVVVVEGDGAEAIAIFDEQFDSRAILLCVADGMLEAIGVKSGSVDGNDLSTDGHSLLVRRPFP